MINAFQQPTARGMIEALLYGAAQLMPEPIRRPRAVVLPYMVQSQRERQAKLSSMNWMQDALAGKPQYAKGSNRLRQMAKFHCK